MTYPGLVWLKMSTLRTKRPFWEAIWAQDERRHCLVALGIAPCAAPDMQRSQTGSASCAVQHPLVPPAASFSSETEEKSTNKYLLQKERVLQVPWRKGQGREQARDMVMCKGHVGAWVLTLGALCLSTSALNQVDSLVLIVRSAEQRQRSWPSMSHRCCDTSLLPT